MNWQASRFEVFEASRFETEEERILLVFVLVWLALAPDITKARFQTGKTIVGETEFVFPSGQAVPSVGKETFRDEN